MSAPDAALAALESDAAAAGLRLHRAMERGTGCRLTADMVHALRVGLIGEWAEAIAARRAVVGGAGA